MDPVKGTRVFAYQPIAVHFRPSGPHPPREGRIIRATVHVDDPAAARCTFAWTLEQPSFTVPDFYAIAWCRERLVVNAYEVIGTDPAY